MVKNYLFVVEGEEDEKIIFKCALEKYGFHAISCEEKIDIETVGQLTKLDYSTSKDNVVIIQGPRNRIHDFLLLYNKDTDSIEKLFNYEYGTFQGIFLIYDVDHNDCDDVEEMFSKFQDESSGMLLLSSPCIEVLGDYNKNREEERFGHITEYKADLNNHYQEEKTTAIDYICDNFNECALYYLNKNVAEFNETNIMEHPRLVVTLINRMNERVNVKPKELSYVIYRYYTTVVYVAIAYINGLTKEIKNYKIVKDFFESQIPD